MREAKSLTHGRAPGFAGPSSHPPWPDRLRCESTVRHVFGLIWPRARIEYASGEDGCRVDLREGELCHVVLVPWSMVEVDRGLCLVRAVYRSGLPGAFERAASGLSLSL